MYQTRLNDRNLRRTLLLGATSIAAISLAAPALAQDQGTVETVVVTGSRIPQVGLISASPVTAVGQAELKLEGTTNVETLLNNLPGVFAAQEENLANGSNGTATVDLRGLGSSRTLVLVNGSRLMPGDPNSTQQVADLNNIPAALVDHVEVLTGGASAVYGSDALAGVVNFIMRKDFEGVEVDAQYETHNAANGSSTFEKVQDVSGGGPGQTVFPHAEKNWWGGEIKNATLLIGTNTADGKGNVTAYLSYRNAQPVLEAKRDFSACALGVYPVGPGYQTDTDGTQNYTRCVGSSNFNNFRSKDNLVTFDTNTGFYTLPDGTKTTLNPNTGTSSFPDTRPGHAGKFRGPQAPNNFFEEGSGAQGTQGFGDGHFVPFAASPQQLFNYGPLNFLQRADDRYNAGYFAHYQVNKQFEVYSSMMFTDDHTLSQIAQSALFSGSGPVPQPNTLSPRYQINCNNPLMTPSENQALCGTAKFPSDTQPEKNGQTFTRTLPVFIADPRYAGGGFWDGGGNLVPGQATLDLRRRLVEGGDRIQDIRHTSYRLQIGARGDLGYGWSYDIYGQFGKTLLSETDLNDLSKTRAERALQVVFDSNNNPACIAALPDAKGNIVDPSCVPLDVFNGIGAIPQDQFHYIQNVSLIHGWTEEQVVSGSLTGDLGEWGIQSPWAKSPVALSFGSEYRQERLKLDVSENRTFPLPTGDSTGTGAATFPIPVSGFNVEEGFGELRIPVIQNMPYVEDLTVSGSYRYSSYSSAGSTNSFAAKVEYQPIDDFRFRGSYQRAVRAPNVQELFAPGQIALFGGQDPCAKSATKPGCVGVNGAGTGSTGPLACPAAQCNQFIGGNASLKPETSITRSVGIVFTPTFIDGFTATVDYFDINVSKAIGAVSPSTTIAQCANTGSAFFCDNIHRAGGNGPIFGSGFVSATNINLNSERTRGYDFESNYQTQFSDWDFMNGIGLGGLGGISANFVGTLLERLSFDQNAIGTPTALRAPVTECAGRYGVTCLEPSPRWRHKLRVTWNSPWDFDFSVQWRHISGVKIDADSIAAVSSYVPNFLSFEPNFEKIASFDYIDLSVNFQAFEGISLRAGVNNLFDKDPPAVDSGFFGLAGTAPANANTYPGLYDPLGRTIFVGGTVKF